MNLYDKLRDIETVFQDVERRMSDPEVIADHSAYTELVRKHSEMEPGIQTYRSYLKVKAQIAEAEDLLSDPEMRDMAAQELASLKRKEEVLEEELQVFLLPKDPDDQKNAVVEIRSGTGGEEAALFAADLFRMYTRYAESKGWRVEILSQNETGLGGIKEVCFIVSGPGAYSELKYESGTHRVQRVPDTEASGRVHTSAATVAILPEAEEVDVEMDMKDLRIDTYRASGAGGQHVNKTDSAVRITHIPTGVVVACQDERSQFQNKDKALRLLRTRLYEAQVEQQSRQQAQNRKIQVGSGDRSEKIRTYNFPQNRLTDHRIGLTLYALGDILNGELEDVVEALRAADRLAKMSQN